MVLRSILLIVATLVAVVLVLAVTKPETYRIERSLTINAAPEKIFALINDFHNWSRWEPQDRQDSTLKREYFGAENGIGAVTEWNSSGPGGKGRAAITDSVPFQEISVKVDFVKPFEAHNFNEFVFQPDGPSTKVTWSMRGTNRYFMKVMSVFLNMDRMMGKHFEDGLNDLKTVAEE